MRDFFRAEKLKYRHTSMRGITVVMPLVTVFFAAWLTSEYFAVDSYNWWYIGFYPGFLGIMCSIIGRKDQGKRITPSGHCRVRWRKSGMQRYLWGR